MNSFKQHWSKAAAAVTFMPFFDFEIFLPGSANRTGTFEIPGPYKHVIIKCSNQFYGMFKLSFYADWMLSQSYRSVSPCFSGRAIQARAVTLASYVPAGVSARAALMGETFCRRSPSLCQSGPYCMATLSSIADNGNPGVACHVQLLPRSPHSAVPLTFLHML